MQTSPNTFFGLVCIRYHSLHSIVFISFSPKTHDFCLLGGPRIFPTIPGLSFSFPQYCGFPVQFKPIRQKNHPQICRFWISPAFSSLSDCYNFFRIPIDCNHSIQFNFLATRWNPRFSHDFPVAISRFRLYTPPVLTRVDFRFRLRFQPSL